MSHRTHDSAAVSPRRPRARKWLFRLAIGALAVMIPAAATLTALWHAFPFPIERLERWPASPTVTDRNGIPLALRVSEEEQWRFPVVLDEMSPWLLKATIAAEDRRFYRHPGVDVRAVGRAAVQNFTARRTVSGASTLTMQICRMMDERPRTLRAKLVESFRALQLEQIRTKDEILTCYLNIAPYGRNFRGVEAASWAYFGKRAGELLLDEAALLAGLPQSPARLRPDRFPAAARKRRSIVLDRMLKLGMISELQCRRAELAPVALSPRMRRSRAPHAAAYALSLRPRGGRTTIDADLQREVERLTRDHAGALPAGTDLAVVVIDIERREIAAMIGSADHEDPLDGQVNGVLAWRSPGSALKPFIYAAAFEARRLAPESVVYDVPIHRAGWSPENFDRSYLGEVRAGEALRRSRNVPAVLVAEGVGIDRCAGLMEAAGVRFRGDLSPLSHGGLALAVGGLEVRLLDLTNAYATLGAGGVRKPVRLFLDDRMRAAGSAPGRGADAPIRVLDRIVCAAIEDVLSIRHRRPRSLETLAPADVPWFMWKTGTSSGRRDAWAVGHNHRFAIGVWVGRFSGSGRPEYVGAASAEPLLARLFCIPRLRRNGSPVPAETWHVSRPLPPPREQRERLRVLVPHDRAVYVAVAGQAVIHPEATETEPLVWFLNGKLLTRGRIDRLELAPGSYRLRLTNHDGEGAQVQFTVRAD